MDLTHLSWPFFDPSCFEFARDFDRWACAELGGFEHDEGGVGKAARQIFEQVAAAAGCEIPFRRKHPVNHSRLICAT